MINYGMGAGLAYVHDFNADMNRAQTNQILDDQARLNHENQVALLGDQLTAKHLETTWDNQQLKTFVEQKTKDIGSFVMQNPDYKMNPLLMGQYKSMMNEIQDNEYVRSSMNANSNYGALIKYIQEHPGSETAPDIQHQLSAYENYNKTGSVDGISANRKKFYFAAPDTFDPTVEIGAVYGKLKGQTNYTSGHGLGSTETKVSDGTLMATAASMLAGPEAYKYNRAWSGMSDGQKSFYDNDPVQWIATVGKGYTESSVKAGQYFAPRESSGSGSGSGKGSADAWSAWQHDYYRAQQSQAPTYLPNVDKMLPIIDGKMQIEGSLKVPTTDANGKISYVTVSDYNGMVVDATALKRTQIIDGIPYTQVQVRVPMSDGLVLGDKPLFKDDSWLGTYKGGDVSEIDAYKPVASFAKDKDGKTMTDDDGNPYALITTYVRVPTDPVSQRNYDNAETGQALTNKAEPIRQTGFDVDAATTVANAMGLDASKMQYSPSSGQYYAPDVSGVLQLVPQQ